MIIAGPGARHLHFPQRSWPFYFTSNPTSTVDFTPDHASTVLLIANFHQQSYLNMSLIPSLSNELSPWPRIRLGDFHTTAVDQRTTFPRLRLRRGSSLRSGNTVESPKVRGRASSDAGAVAAKLQVRSRSTSFGSTQGYEGVDGSGPAQRFDRKASERMVDELLKLRKQKLKEADREGDEIELFRLKNLNLFDDIERPQPRNDEPKEVGASVDLTGQPDHHGLKSVSQGHTATLCWHLKLEYTQGLLVPEEFSQCNIHPTPSPRASSSSTLTPQPASPGSIRPRSTSSLSHTKVSSIDSSTLRGSEPSSPATTLPKEIGSETSLTAKASSIVSNAHEEDPFLYIAKYIKRHAKSNNNFEEAKQSAAQVSNADTKRSTHTQCTCKSHSCRNYLSGSPSKHCRNCRLPRPQPEITAAVDRIEQMKRSVSAQATTSLPAESSEADEFRKLEALQEDMKLVEMYNAETEKRCRKGVWWEGWLIVQDLKRQGIVGSVPFIYAGDKSLAG